MKDKLFNEVYMRCWGPTKAHSFSTQVNSTKFHFFGVVELVCAFGILKIRLKKKLKNEDLLREFEKTKFSFLNLR